MTNLNELKAPELTITYNNKTVTLRNLTSEEYAVFAQWDALSVETKERYLNKRMLEIEATLVEMGKQAEQKYSLMRKEFGL